MEFPGPGVRLQPVAAYLAQMEAIAAVLTCPLVSPLTGSDCALLPDPGRSSAPSDSHPVLFPFLSSKTKGPPGLCSPRNASEWLVRRRLHRG